MHPDLRSEKEVEEALREKSWAFVEALRATRESRVALGQKLIVVWVGPDDETLWPDIALWRLWVYSPTTSCLDLLDPGKELGLPTIGPELPVHVAGIDARDLRVGDDMRDVLAEVLVDYEQGDYDPGPSDGAFVVGYIGPDEDETDARKLITIHLIPELRWCHTHGLAERGLPELEVRDVPVFLFGAAGGLLNDVASYLLKNPPGHVKLGETMSVGEFCRFRFTKLEPIAPDQASEYKAERWCLAEVPMPCSCCGGEIESCPGGTQAT